MKTFKELINERMVVVSDFFNKKFIDNFIQELSEIYEHGADSDTDAAVNTLLAEAIKRNGDLKTGIVGACEDIVKEFK